MLIPDVPRTSPERQGIVSSALLHFVEALDNQIHVFSSMHFSSVIAIVFCLFVIPASRSHAFFSMDESMRGESDM